MAGTDFSVADLQKAMEGASDDLKREMGRLVDAAAHSMVGMLHQRYPQGKTGTLRGRVFVSQPRQFAVTSTGQAILAKRVRATAPHVHIWQEGTQERFDATRANARRGRMPAGGKVFEASASDARRRMLDDIQAILDRNREL